MVKQPGAQQRRVLGEMGQSYEQQAKQAEGLQKTAMQDAAKMVASAEAMQPATRGGVTIRKPPPGATTAQTVAGVQQAQQAASRSTLAGRDFGALARGEVMRRMGMDPNAMRQQAATTYGQMQGTGTMGRQILEDTARAAGSELAGTGVKAAKAVLGGIV
jgi:hypothetical protein